MDARPVNVSYSKIVMEMTKDAGEQRGRRARWKMGSLSACVVADIYNTCRLVGRLARAAGRAPATALHDDGAPTLLTSISQ